MLPGHRPNIRIPLPSGFVWCNPPYGTQTGLWLDRMARHNNGIALIFARTDTLNFHKHIFPKATALLFIKGRLTFFHVTGEKGDNSAGAPSVLVAYGAVAAERLKNSGIAGAYLQTAATREQQRSALGQYHR